MNARAAAVAELTERLGYHFNDPAILERALTHSSVGDGARSGQDNERLEFLGDRVLGLVIAEHLIAAAPDAREGDLAPRLNALVSRAACARVARRIGLGPALRLSPAETRAGGRDKDSILAGACEALVAAAHLDGGLEVARRLILEAWRAEFDQLGDPRARDAKTRLQEWAQGLGLPLPTYRVAGRTGPEHAPVFTVEVVVQGRDAATGCGPSRQAAEKAAAEALIAREAAA